MSKFQNNIVINGSQFEVNGKPFFLYSGEMHYFRMPENLWKIHVQKAKLTGLNAISAYIPWGWHEFEEGKFDFEGKTHPQRNLIKFIKLVQDAGLYLSARVGPVSNAEMVNEGLPSWLLNKPDIFIQNPPPILLAYLNPSFLSFVEKWYAQILPVVSEKQIHKGGNIIMVQLCNEIGMIHWLTKCCDRSPFAKEIYQKFLEEKYHTIVSLNEAYQTQYFGFKEISLPESKLTRENWKILFDWALFYRRYYALYYQSLAQTAKQHEITVPMSANIPQFYDYDVRGRGIYSPMTTSLFRDFSDKTPQTVFGGAYQMRRLDFENFHDITVTTEAVKAIADAPSVCAELQTGILRDRPRLYPSDVDLNIKTSAAHGLNGINCYMFSSGKNLDGMGLFGTYHDWQAPVSLDGTEKEHLRPMKEWGQFVKKYGDIFSATKKMTDTALGMYLPYYATEYFTGEEVHRLEFLRSQYFFDGFARLLQISGFNFDLCDLMKTPLEELKKHKSLLVFSLEVMDIGTQDKLSQYVQSGGKLMIGPQVPAIGLSGKKCTKLAESLGITVKKSEKNEMILWNEMECAFDFPIQTYEGNSFVPIVKTKSGLNCVIRDKNKNSNWLVYGLPMNHGYDYHSKMMGEWAAHIGVKKAIEVEPWDIHAVMRWKDDKGFLFLFNYHDIEKKGTVKFTLDPYGSSKICFSKRFDLSRRSAKIIYLKLSKNKLKEARK